MSTQHTPGPWLPQYMGDVNGVRMSWLVKDKLSIGTRNAADEALASAAPDLLGALQTFVAEYVAMVESGDAGCWDPEAEDKVIAARAAIAKAVSA